MKLDAMEAARRFAAEHEAEICEIYAEVSRKKLLPATEDCAPELRRLVSSSARFSYLATSHEFIAQLHLYGRQLFVSDLLRKRQEAALEQKYRKEVEKLDIAVGRHKATLYSKLKRAVRRDDYGSIISDHRRSVLLEFFRSQKIAQETEGASEVAIVSRLLAHCEEVMSEYEAGLSSQEDHGLKQLTRPGQGFEIWVEEALSRIGWAVKRTAASGDQGVDLIAEFRGLRAAVQCKDYSGSVGNRAVQEVIAGMRHYGLDRAVVVSTGTYTKGARELAFTNGTLLLAPQDLPVMYDLLIGQ